MNNIMINATALNSAGGRSVGLNFIKSLTQLMADGFDNYYVYVPPNCGYESEICSKGRIKIIYIAAKLQRWYLRPNLDLYLKNEIKINSINILFSMGNIALDIKLKKQILLIHWPYLVYPKSIVWQRMNLTEKLKRKLRRQLTINRFKYVDVFLFQTTTMKSRFEKEFQKKLKKYSCKIIPNGVSVNAHIDKMNVKFQNSILSRIKSKKMFLCLTRYYTHKNIEILVEVAKICKKKNENICFVITIDSSQGKGAADILKKIKKYELSEYLINIGVVSWSNVPSLYDISSGIILPTLLESYSGVFIESMNYNKKILTSDMDFSREVCNDSAIYFNPLDANDIYKKVIEFSNSKINENENKKMNDFIDSNNNSWTKISQLIVEELNS